MSDHAGVVNFQAGERHFVDHLAPLWHAFPPEHRGEFYCGTDTNPGERRHELALRQAKNWGILHPKPAFLADGSQGVCVVPSIGDLGIARRMAPRTRFVFMEHGCGITYNVTRSSYLGSTNRPSVDLILVPNDHAARIQKGATPEIRVESLGSSPRLDRWANNDHVQGDPPTVCLSFHWDCEAVPETRSSLYWYRKRLGEIMDRGWNVIGHSHPRIWATAKLVYEHWGIEPIRQFEEVMDRADLYAVGS